MRAMRVRHPAGLDNLVLDGDVPSRSPGPGEVRVRIHASSLNYHDYVVASGYIPTPEGRIPMWTPVAWCSKSVPASKSWPWVTA